jgi:hypothetical protein
MVQYYTLEQAAQILRTTPEQLKEMARKNELRAFQDRGTLRFRAQEINELARARGFGSDPELPLGEAPAAKAGAPEGGDVFNFSLGAEESDEVPIGQEPPSAKSKPHTPPSSRKPPSSKGPKSPPPKASSDSDVRLVMDGNDLDFKIEVDSDGPKSKPPVSPPPKVGSSKSRLGGGQPADSKVRIVPLGEPSDSDVKIVPGPGDSGAAGPHPAKRPSDSDIRIEEQAPPGPRDAMVTEEIDLDAEARKAAESAKQAKATKHRPKGPGGSPVLPTSSPFELSENDLDMPAPAAAGPRPAEEAPADTDSSSDFELKPLSEQSPQEPSSGEMPVLMGDDEVELGKLTGASGGSGINLQDPADSGISLEQGGSDEIEFELSLDAGSTPKPTSDANVGGDSGSEFELSLQEDDLTPASGDSSSEFELSLDPEGSSELAVDEGSSDLAMETPGSDSDSEFELTLDEGGSLAPAEEAAEGEDKDIFETDFEVPALDEESGSEAVALDEADTDLESSSDFDLSLGAEESGSQVVPLEDEEEADEGAATVQRRAVPAVAEDEEGLEDLDKDLDQEPQVEEEEAPAEVAAAAAAPPAEWHPLLVISMLVSTIVLFVVSLMSFEMVQGMWGYHKGNKVSNLIIHPIAKTVSGEDNLPDN